MILVNLLLFFNFTCTHANQIENEIATPSEFPGHSARKITGTVALPNHFNPEDYRQERLKGEAACNFNSLFAGIMHFPYGREKCQSLIVGQDEDAIYFRFYFPDSQVLQQYPGSFHAYIQENQAYVDYFAGNSNPDPFSEEEKQDLANALSRIEKAPAVWEKACNRSRTTIKVPKNFVSRKEGGSFPCSSPNAINLLEQAYMMVMKNSFLTPPCIAGFSFEEEIQKDDVFINVPYCCFYEDYPQESDQQTNTLKFFPLIDIPLKSIEVCIPDENTGLDLQACADTIEQFTHKHGLTKDFLMKSNIFQFGTAGHMVCLLFGDEKVYYYDNVFFPPQESVYGSQGPIYEEAKYFRNKSISEMSDNEFFTRLFKEVGYRLHQVATIRERKSDTKIEIVFFEKPLVSAVGTSEKN